MTAEVDYCRICGSEEDKDSGERYCNGCLWSLGEGSKPPAALSERAAKGLEDRRVVEGFRALEARERSLRKALGRVSRESLRRLVP